MNRDPFDLVGDVLDGQFRVDAFAGEGDLSVVYKGHHLGVDATVAIKCLNLPETLDPALARPLVDGFKEASRVHYRLARGNLHIAQTIASGSTLVPRSGVVVPYLVREWFEGESLASDLAWRRSEKLQGRPVEEALALLETAFDGIAYAHAQGEVHLSLNPSNLFVVLGEGPNGPTTTLKVLDFGVARTMNAFTSGVPSKGKRPASGLRLLFPAYAAPEQLDRSAGDLGPWTDVYAMALVMMEVLSDRVVMKEVDSGAIVEHALDEQRRPTPQAHGLRLPSHIERALARAVARSPGRRQKNAAELWKDVRNTVRTLPRTMLSAGPSSSMAPVPPQVVPSQTPIATATPATETSWAASTTPMPSRVPTPMPSRIPTPMPSRAPIPPAFQQALTPAPPRVLTPGPGRARAPTLVGLSPPALSPAMPNGPPVLTLPWSADHSNRVPPTPSVVTKPMAFEPMASPTAGALRISPQGQATAAPNSPAIPTPPMPSMTPLTSSPVAPVPAAAALESPADPWAPPDLPSANPPSRSDDPPSPFPAPSSPAEVSGPSSPPLAAEPALQAGHSPPAPFASSPIATVPAPVAPVSPPGAAPTLPLSAPEARPFVAAMPTPSTPPAFAESPAMNASQRVSLERRPQARRVPSPLAFPFTPRGAPIVLSVAGGLFWMWALGVSLWFFALPLRHPHAGGTAAPLASMTPIASTTAASAAAAPGGQAPSAPGAHAIEAAVAPGPAASADTAPTAVAAPPAAAAPGPPTESGTMATSGAPFRNAAAVRALDGRWRDVAKCRRGKVWGKASTTVTFANDGTVTHVDVGSPFSGTPTADCVSDTLSTVRVEPFADKVAVLVYRVYVAPR